MKYQESKLAHILLDGLFGIEIGGSAHNDFGLNTQNVDYSGSEDTIYKCEEIKLCNESMHVDIVAPGDNLPLSNESQDFVISSHVLEHFPDPIKALNEWYRVIRRGGYIFMIVPHKERTFDKERERTTLKELIDKHEGRVKLKDDFEKHHSVWITEDLISLIGYLGWNLVFFQDIDDKVGNGFTIVIQKGEDPIYPSQISNEIKTLLYEKSGCIIRNKEDIASLAYLNDSSKFLREKDQKIMQLEQVISNMYSSKFWKLRKAYLKLKEVILK